MFNDCHACTRILAGSQESCAEHDFDADEAFDIDQKLESFEESRRRKIAERNEW